MFIFGAAVLLLSGCGAEEPQTGDSAREVSSEFRPWMNSSGLNVEQDLKESGVSYEDAPIEFQDEAIEEMVRNLIGKPEGEIYISEVQDIHAIYWRTDVGYFSNLQSSDGTNPKVNWEIQRPKSLEDLKYFYNLQWIQFGGGMNVPSFEPLCSLPQLETIEFSGVIVTDEVFEGLLDFPQLKALVFSRINITERKLEVIGQLPKLTSLEIEHYDRFYNLGTNWGKLTDGSFILPLADQLTHLEASGNIDWNPDVLSQMTKLESLMIDYAEDISFLEQLTELKKLSMYCCTSEDWSAFHALKNLEHLEISGNMWVNIDIPLDDLRPLTNLDYLEVIFTSINKEYSRKEIIEALPSLTGLRCQLE